MSEAKFNIEKTEVILIGSETHQNRIIISCKLNPNDQMPLNDHIRIAKNGEAIRLLGAWIGNNTNLKTPWELIIDNIHKALKNWGKSKPTLDGQKTIIQAIIEGYTQFLTKTQGMPTNIEETLMKMARDFI